VQAFTLGEGFELTVFASSEGWDLVLSQPDSLEAGRVFLRQTKAPMLLKKGATLRQGEIEVRGLRWEVEIRFEGQILGRIRKEDFEAALSNQT
jgi:hypothetical protein